jgi:hypothetical protein
MCVKRAAVRYPGYRHSYQNIDNAIFLKYQGQHGLSINAVSYQGELARAGHSRSYHLAIDGHRRAGCSRGRAA